MSVEQIKKAAKEAKALDQVNPPFKPKSAGFMFTSVPKEREFLLGPIPKGIVGMITGHGSVGKGFLYADLAISLALGLDALGGRYHTPKKTRSLIISCEDDQEELHRRLYSVHKQVSSHSSTINFGNIAPLSKEAKKPIDNIDFFCPKGISVECVDEHGAYTKFGQSLIDYLATEEHEYGLILFDTLRRGMSGDENSSKNASHIISFLERVAKKSGASVLAIHHMAKSTINASQNQHAARGSSALTDGMRFQLNLAHISERNIKRYGIPESEQKLYLELCVTKNNYGPPQTCPLFLKRCENGVLQFVDLDVMEVNSFKETLTEILNNLDDPLSKTKFINRYAGADGCFGLSKPKLKGALDRAVKDGLIYYDKQKSVGGQGAPPELVKLCD